MLDEGSVLKNRIGSPMLETDAKKVKVLLRNETTAV